jgi:hypothetical protein
MQKNNKKMTCLAAILMAALAALLIFAIVDANRINRSLSELQQTVNYEERWNLCCSMAQPLKLPRRLQQPKPQRLWSRS